MKHGQKPEKCGSPSVLFTRPPIERMLRFHEDAKAGKYPNCARHAKRMEVCEKAIADDIEFMRTRLLLPLEYDERKHGWYYAEKVGAFPTVHVSESEALWLMIGQFAMESFPGLDESRKMRSAIEKLTAPVMEEFNSSPEHTRQIIHFRPGRSVMKVADEVIRKLFEGLLNSLELEFGYQKPEESAPRLRRVQPLTLLWVDGGFYLFAVDPSATTQGKVRTFALCRITEPRVTRQRFERSPDFDLKKELADAFGIHGGGVVEDVRLRFYGTAARRISERIWHSSQQTTLLKDQTLEMTMRVAINPEFEQWVLGWGGEVEVIESRMLRERIGKHVRKMAQRYLDGELRQ